MSKDEFKREVQVYLEMMMESRNEGPYVKSKKAADHIVKLMEYVEVEK